eukprot:m.169017 g.169017  ORF g.169017 m.169017 type:complete len:133 (+) comp13037_c0_seq1:231-629(+)
MVDLETKFAGQPFKILAFPCNEFLFQEPHANSVIETFARGKGFKGPMFAKTNVNAPCSATDGCQANSTACCPANVPVWTYLKSVSAVQGNGKIPWNFEKYLCGKDGVPIERTGASDSPDGLEAKIQALLASA